MKKRGKSSDLPTLDLADTRASSKAALELFDDMDDATRSVGERGIHLDLERVCRAVVFTRYPTMDGVRFEVIVGGLAWAMCSKYTIINSGGRQ